MAIFKPADILIPQNVDFTKWSVVACDQYTSEREYWEDVKNIVGDSPSTLNIIFPEVYLEDGDGDERIKKINSTMEEYINQGIFRELKDSFIYVGYFFFIPTGDTPPLIYPVSPKSSLTCIISTFLLPETFASFFKSTS